MHLHYDYITELKQRLCTASATLLLNLQLMMCQMNAEVTIAVTKEVAQLSQRPPCKVG